jgi:hypothetical protein
VLKQFNHHWEPAFMTNNSKLVRYKQQRIQTVCDSDTKKRQALFSPPWDKFLVLVFKNPFNSIGRWGFMPGVGVPRHNGFEKCVFD